MNKGLFVCDNLDPLDAKECRRLLDPNNGSEHVWTFKIDPMIRAAVTNHKTSITFLSSNESELNCIHKQALELSFKFSKKITNAHDNRAGGNEYEVTISW